MSFKPIDSEAMETDTVVDNSKEIKINGINCGAYVDCETIQCDLNENERPGLKDPNSLNLPSCLEKVDKALDIVNLSPSEYGDSKVSEPADIDAFNISEMCEDCLKSEAHELSSLTDEKDPAYSKNCLIHDVNSTEVAEALAYFDSSSIEVGDIIREEAAVEAICEDKLFPTSVPNGISKTTLTKGMRSNVSNKQSLYNKKKCKKIFSALENNDVEALKRAALSEGGLLNDEIRRKVWPKLVGVDVYETSPRPCQKEIEAHPYYGQVVLDVNRSLKRFPPSIHEAQRLMMLDQLVFLIMRVLCKHPEMHYYQGYHDICVTFLLVLGEETAYYVIEKLSTTHLKVFMERNMEPTIHLLEHMYVLIGKKNPVLKEFLLKSEVGVAYCLSWLITWFGHVLNDYNYVVRLFDFFIVSHPYMPMYLTSAIVLHQESDVLKQDCDMASVHSFLSNISDDLPFEELILDSMSLLKDFTPKMLSIEHPYVPRSLMKPKKKFSLFQSITKTIKFVVPASNIAIPIVVAAAVLVTAVLYQAYKY